MSICKGTEKYSSGSLTFSEMEDRMFLILPCPFPTIKDTFLAILDDRNRSIAVSKRTSSKAYIMNISCKYAFYIYDL